MSVDPLTVILGRSIWYSLLQGGTAVSWSVCGIQGTQRPSLKSSILSD